MINASRPRFHFKQFSLSDAGCGMKIGTDGVLLGAVAARYASCAVLDVGTGCALIALMVAQKNVGPITALEIDPHAVARAQENVQNSPWPRKIQVMESSFQDFCSKTTQKFDLIVCNPPFFHHSLKPGDLQRSQARHSSLLPPGDLISGSAGLLSDHGKLLLIIPADQLYQILQLAENHRLFITRKIWVSPCTGKPAKRVIVEISRENAICNEENLVIEDKGRHGYSKEYQALTGDYYLNF